MPHHMSVIRLIADFRYFNRIPIFRLFRFVVVLVHPICFRFFPNLIRADSLFCRELKRSTVYLRHILLIFLDIFLRRSSHLQLHSSGVSCSCFFRSLSFLFLFSAAQFPAFDLHLAFLEACLLWFCAFEIAFLTKRRSIDWVEESSLTSLYSNGLVFVCNRSLNTFSFPDIIALALQWSCS